MFKIQRIHKNFWNMKLVFLPFLKSKPRSTVYHSQDMEAT